MTLSLEWIDEREEGFGPKEEAMIRMLEKLLQLAGETEGVEHGMVTLILTDDEGIRELNREYRGLDKPTDVLSFPLLEPGEEEPEIVFDGEYELADDDSGEWSEAAELEHPFASMLGDIVISVPRAEAQAAEYGHSLERELGFLFVHGFLHLLGYDHENAEEEKIMFAKQEEILAKAGLTR